MNPSPTLRAKIGQMLLVGFRGYQITDADPIAHHLAELNLGGLLLFDKEMADTSRSGRNIQSPQQIRELVHSLHSRAQTPLWVAIDQEGGRVNRLKPDYGFPATLSHEELGALNDLSQTAAHAAQIAATLASLGINLNLAPVVDLDAGPDNPIIKAKKRSFSSDPEVVARQALTFSQAHKKAGVLTCLKHFPGHGSAHGDTHLGLVDVTKYWTERELIPFQRLIEAGQSQLIMSAHVMNSALDASRPATLSKSVLQGLLRQKLGFKGIIVSDDMEMKAIGDHYGLEAGIQYAIEAGIDLLCFGNNMSFDANIAQKASDIIYRLVESGKITEARIDESYQRILALKREPWILYGAK